METDHRQDHPSAWSVPGCDAVASRGDSLEAVLDRMRRDVAEDRFSDALGHFRQALNLARGFPALGALTSAEAARLSAKLLPRNLRVAEAIIQELTAADPGFSIDARLQGDLRSAREEEMLTRIIHQADRAHFEGRTAEARQRLLDLLAAYPTDRRIKEAIHELDRPAQAPPAQDSPASPVLPTPLPHSVERPSDSEPILIAASPPGPKNLRVRIVIASSTLNAIKNLAALAAALIMLSGAGFLIWRHFSPAPAPPASTDRDAILQAVRLYRQKETGANHNGGVLEEPVIRGSQATLRYRLSEPGTTAPAVTFSLARHGNSWQVQSVR